MLWLQAMVDTAAAGVPECEVYAAGMAAELIT